MLTLSISLSMEFALMKGGHCKNRLESHTSSHIFVESFLNCPRMYHNLSILLVYVRVKSLEKMQAWGLLLL